MSNVFRFIVVACVGVGLAALGCTSARPQAKGLLSDTKNISVNNGRPLITIDLSKIGHIAPKARVQDKEYNQLEIIDQLMSHKADSIPFLISKLEDETKIEPAVLDYWYSTTVGDVALVVLTDFMTSSDGKTNTGFSWEELFGVKKDPSMTAEEYLRRQLESRDRAWLRKQWETRWLAARPRLSWDDKDLYFAFVK
jgi:hypothetical protein